MSAAATTTPSTASTSASVFPTTVSMQVLNHRQAGARQGGRGKKTAWLRAEKDDLDTGNYACQI